MGNLEELARAIATASYPITVRPAQQEAEWRRMLDQEWRSETGYGPKEWWAAITRAFLRHLRFPEDTVLYHPPAEGAGAKAIAALDECLAHFCRGCSSGGYPHCKDARGQGCLKRGLVRRCDEALAALKGED